jgi:hypothetical protein
MAGRRQNQPTAPQDPLYPLGIKAKLTGNAAVINSASATWYQSSTSQPMLIDANAGAALPQTFPTNFIRPVMDATAAENGIKLKKGVYRYHAWMRWGDVTVAGSGTLNTQCAIITKDTPDTTGLIALSPIIPSTGHAGGDLSLKYWLEDIQWTDAGYFTILVDDTTVQITVRRDGGAAGSVVVKDGTFTVERVGNVAEANV